MQRHDLEKMLAWACARVEAEDYSYDTLYQYMKLIDALHTLLPIFDLQKPANINKEEPVSYLRVVK